MKTLAQCFNSNVRIAISFMRLASTSSGHRRAVLIGKAKAFIVPVRFAATDKALSEADQNSANKAAARIERVMFNRWGAL